MKLFLSEPLKLYSGQLKLLVTGPDGPQLPKLNDILETIVTTTDTKCVS